MYQGLFLYKRSRPDIMPDIAYCTTRVLYPNKDGWKKLRKIMIFLKLIAGDIMTLKADNIITAHWHTDVAFAVHLDFRSHTGYTMLLGKGSVTASNRKQGMNTHSSTEAEIVGSNKSVGPMLWTLLFMEVQKYLLEQNILYQDNKSSILLESNVRKSTGKQSRHLNIRLFFMTDQKEKSRLSIMHCPTEEITVNYLSKPLIGQKFKKFGRD